MAGETALGTRLAPGQANGKGDPHRLRRRRSLPGGRAVVGGFLVALAAVGTFAGYLSATTTSEQRYLVARRDLAVGHRITASDLSTVSMDLPPSLQRRSYGDAARLVGATVLGPVGRGELVQSSDVLIGRGRSAAGSEISLAIEASRAVAGQLRPGELIDVLATYGSDTDAFTVVVARGARIADRSDADDALAGGQEQMVILSVPTAEDAAAVAHAVDVGTVTLVRSNETGTTEAYRTPSPQPAGAVASEPVAP